VKHAEARKKKERVRWWVADSEQLPVRQQRIKLRHHGNRRDEGKAREGDSRRHALRKRQNISIETGETEREKKKRMTDCKTAREKERKRER
jgi:hypothetical protein